MTEKEMTISGLIVANLEPTTVLLHTDFTVADWFKIDGKNFYITFVHERGILTSYVNGVRHNSCPSRSVEQVRVKHEMKEKYYAYKESVDKGYAGGLIPEITDYVIYLEEKNTELQRQKNSFHEVARILEYRYTELLNIIKKIQETK